MSDISAHTLTQNPIDAGASDQELLDRFIAVRDEAAFARLVERHGGTIWRLCRRILHKEHDAEDAYQAAFIVLARKASSIRSGEAVGSWLYRVAYRIALNARKSLQSRPESQEEPVEMAAGTPPWSEAAVREMQRILDEEVNRLPEKHRAPFILCCLEGMSKPEAARELNWPEETVKARLAQARKLLQSRLARRGIVLSAVLTALALTQNAASAAGPAVLVFSASGASASASALADAFTGGFGASKLKAIMAVLLAVFTTIAGAGLAMHYFNSDAQEPEPPIAAVAVGDPKTFVAPPTPLMKPHDEQVLAVALSPDGKRLVTAGARQTLPGQFIVWDVESRTELARVRDVRGIRGVAFSPDGTTVACAAFDGGIHLRDAQTGKEQAVLLGHKAGINAVAYSAGGDLLASAGLDKIVKVWDINSRAEKTSFAGHADMVFSVAYFRHGKAIVSGSKDRSAKIWDMDTGTLKFNLACPAAVEAVAISPDDQLVATGCWDQHIKLWNAETGKEEADLPGTDGLILAVAFSPDGALLASTSMDGSVRIWDVKTRQPTKHIKAHASSNWSVAFTNDSKKLATGSSDKTAKLWDVETGKEIATLKTAQLKRVQAIAYAPDGKSLAVAGEDEFVQIRDAQTGRVRVALGGHSGVVNCVAISPDGATLASGSDDKSIRLWDLKTATETRTLTGHTGAVLALAFAKDGKLASAGADKLIRCWDLAGAMAKAPIALEGHEDAVRAVAFSHDGATLASGGDDRAIRLWNMGKETPPRLLKGHQSTIRALAFSADGLLASAGDDCTVKLWEPGADKEKRTLTGHGRPVLALAFTPRGNTLVSGGADKNVIVWDPATGNLRDKLSGHKSSVTALAMHPQGDDLVTGSDDTTLQRWRTESVNQVKGLAQPAQANAGAGIQAPLKSRPNNLPRLKLVGLAAEKRIRFEPAGMRMTVPAGLQRAEGHVYLSTGIALKGDFEVTVNYEILKLPEPKDAGPETGVTLLLWRGKSDRCLTGMTRRVVENKEPQFSAWCTWFASPGEPTDHKEILAPTQATSGRLRLERRGKELSYFASERTDAELKLLNQLTVGEADFDDLRLLGFVGGPSASLDARFWDLRIRSGNDPAAPVPAAVAPASSNTLWWLAVPALALFIALLGAGLMLLRWLRRSRLKSATNPAGKVPQSTVSYISFSCTCGKALKTRPKDAGKKVKCPTCGVLVAVPRHDSP